MIQTITNNKLRFQPSGMNSRFEFGAYSFAEYVSRMREIIEATRIDLNHDNAEIILDANSPFEWVPNDETAINPKNGRIKNGILFIHGLFDSPYTLHSIAQHFMQKNYLVRSILLPGHGTRPGDMLGVSYKEWLKATKFGIMSFQNQVDNFHVCGFSTGAALALHQAYSQQQSIRSIILFSPAIRFYTQYAIMSNINHLITRNIRGQKWYFKTYNSDYAKYQSFTFYSAHQVYLITKQILNFRRQQLLTIPIYMALTVDDEVISPQACLNFFKYTHHPLSRCRAYTRKKINNDDTRIMPVNSYYPEKKILSLSHMSLPIAPNHPHYGIDSDFEDFSHYEFFYGKTFNRKSAPTSEIYSGAITRENLRKYHLKRLTYNPDYDEMIIDIDAFIESIFSS